MSFFDNGHELPSVWHTQHTQSMDQSKRIKRNQVKNERTSEEEPEKEEKKRSWLRRGCKEQMFILIIIMACVAVAAAALGLGLYYGLKDDEATSRLQFEPWNAAPQFQGRVSTTDIEWRSGMSDTASQVFKATASEIERNLDKHFRNSALAPIYGYSVVTRLWRSSVGCDFRMYLKTQDSEVTVSPTVAAAEMEIRAGRGAPEVIQFLMGGQNTSLETQARSAIVFFNLNPLRSTATTQPTTTHPATTQPATTQPATTEPATTQPATKGARVHQPVALRYIDNSVLWDTALSNRTTDAFGVAEGTIKRNIKTALDSLDLYFTWLYILRLIELNGLTTVNVIIDLITDTPLSDLEKGIKTKFEESGDVLDNISAVKEMALAVGPGRVILLWFDDEWREVCYSDDLVERLCMLLGYSSGDYTKWPENPVRIKRAIQCSDPMTDEARNLGNCGVTPSDIEVETDCTVAQCSTTDVEDGELDVHRKCMEGLEDDDGFDDDEASGVGLGEGFKEEDR